MTLDKYLTIVECLPKEKERGMTREEAVERLKSIKSLVDKYDDVVALREAIKALEQEPCEDAISRQAAIEAIYDNKDRLNIAQAIRELPSINPQEPSDISNDGTLTVNVEDGRKISRVLVCGANHWGGLYYPDEQEPKTGHWIMHIDDLFPAESTMECNKCHERQPITIDDNYCPSCGAKMVEPQESEGKDGGV